LDAECWAPAGKEGGQVKDGLEEAGLELAAAVRHGSGVGLGQARNPARRCSPRSRSKAVTRVE
jgi:hypothetical protein